jgi:hypothetical protein
MVPEMQEHPQIRRPERVFVMWLQLAWFDATGKMPPLTAHRAKPGPFARLAQAALARLGVPHANAVELINDLDRIRKEPVTSQSMNDDDEVCS